MNRYEVYFADGTFTRVSAFDSDIACALAQSYRLRSQEMWALNSNRPYARLCDACDRPLCDDGECLFCTLPVPARENSL